MAMRDIDGLGQRVAALSEASGGLPDAEGQRRQPAGLEARPSAAYRDFRLRASPRASMLPAWRAHRAGRPVPVST